MEKLGLALLLLLVAAPVLAQQDPTGAAPPGPEAGSSAPSNKADSDTLKDNASPASKADAALPDLAPDANGALSQEQMQQLFRVVADKDVENDKRQRDYTYIEREVENKLDGKGQVKSTEAKTYEVLEIYGEQVQRLIEKDDKPLSEKEAAKEEEKIQKIIDKRKNESDSDRKKREEKEQKDREEGRRFVREVADAYNFKLVGTELVGDREAWVIDGEPRPGFVPHMKESKFLSKFRGRVWIDKTDLQLAKMDVECLDTISWGVFLARFHKGSRFMLEQTRVNEEVWLPRQLAAKIDVRLALLKNFNVDIEQSYRDYRKFRTSAKIVGVGEVKP
ncbi:MAG: outer membrane lipoprotein-sorting protein [Acidobacteriia bacterium]|nr:outer membrane lipoprotein-sorting protein [Terriglobia bacterium]